MKQGKVYKNAVTGKRYKGGKQGSALWIAEKLLYCWIDKDGHEGYFEKAKYESKRPTVVRTVQPECLAFYRKYMNIYEDWLNEKDETNATPKDIVRSAIQDDLIDTEEYDKLCASEDSSWDRATRWYALENYDKHIRIIEKLDQIRSRLRNQKHALEAA